MFTHLFDSSVTVLYKKTKNKQKLRSTCVQFNLICQNCMMSYPWGKVVLWLDEGSGLSFLLVIHEEISFYFPSFFEVHCFNYLRRVHEEFILSFVYVSYTNK